MAKKKTKGTKSKGSCQRPEISYAAMDAFFGIFGLYRVSGEA